MSAPQSLLQACSRNVMVTGSRGWSDAAAIDKGLSRHVREGDVLMHGDAKGADRLAASWAALYGIYTVDFPPEYSRYGSEAPHVRNDEMLSQADFVVAFWDGKSRGTASVIKKARDRGLPIEVYGADDFGL